MRDIYFPSSDGKHTVHACVWNPAGEVKGVVQIIHGMCEYAERYAPFAEFLNSHGYLVCADDHLGHGKTAESSEELGYFNDERDYMRVIEDVHTLYCTVKKEAGDVPYFILGHSMGSFFCRKYISLYGSDFSGAVIMGSGFKDKLTLGSALFAVKLNALFCGWRNRSKLIKNLAFGSYNKKFSPASTENDWLSANSENVTNYNSDPLCGFMFTNNGYKVLFTVIKQACSKKVIAAVPKDLPVFFVAGADDPVGDYGKGVLKAERAFKNAGVKNVSCKLYKGNRHEILNDYCKDEVYADILAFLEGNLN